MLPSGNLGDYDSGEDLETGVDFDQIEPAEADARIRRRQLIEAQRREDEEYEGEWGYALVRALRGKTVGRRLRRKLFKYGIFQLCCGFSLWIMAILETDNFQNTSYFDSAKYGATLTSLTWCVSFPSFLLGCATMTAFRHWASLVTNRRLLVDLLRIYTVALLIILILALWLICAVFLTFRNVQNWRDDVTLAAMFPYYVCTLIFLLPYLPVLLFYTLDVSYLVDEVERGGVIEELDPPKDAKDMGDVTVVQSFVFVCGMPCILCIQFFDLASAVRTAYERHYRESPLVTCPSCCPEKSKVYSANAAPKKAQKKSTIWTRLWRTLKRCLRGQKRKTDVKPMIEIQELPLKELENDREREERETREKILREQAEERQRYAQKEAEALAEFQRLQQLELEEAARRLEEQLEQEKRAREEQEAKADRWESILTVAQYKSLWSTLGTNGSFQCNLKSMPNQDQLVDHLKRQGFHVVFSVSPNANDIEIGICNIRPMGQEAWFMARFLASNNSFSAVMKAQDASLVPSLVKKFALAKVLKIDTPGK